MKIVAKTFITIMALFFPLAVVVLLFSSGERTLDYKSVIDLFNYNLDKYNLYGKILQNLNIMGENASLFQQHFFLTDNVLEFSKKISEGLHAIKIPFIGNFLNLFVNMLTFSFSLITIIVELLLNVLGFLCCIVATSYELLSTFTTTSVVN